MYLLAVGARAHVLQCWEETCNSSQQLGRWRHVHCLLLKRWSRWPSLVSLGVTAPTSFAPGITAATKTLPQGFCGQSRLICEGCPRQLRRPHGLIWALWLFPQGCHGQPRLCCNRQPRLCSLGYCGQLWLCCKDCHGQPKALLRELPQATKVLP